MTAMPSDPHALLSITKWYQRITEESALQTMRMLRLHDNLLAE